MYLCAVSNNICGAVSVWCLCGHLSGAWLLHRSQLFSVFLPPAYGLLCSQQSFIGFLLMVRAPLPHLGLCLCSLCSPVLLPGACSHGSLPSHPPCLITPAWLPPYQPPTSLPFHNLLVSGGFCRAGYLTSWILIPPHHQAGSLNHIVLQTLCDLYSLFMIRVSPSGAWPWFLVAGNVEVDKRVQQEFKIFGGLNVKWIQVYWSFLSCF